MVDGPNVYLSLAREGEWVIPSSGLKVAADNAGGQGITVSTHISIGILQLFSCHVICP